jgi:hypothetical protein
VFGGAAMALAYDSRRATRDADAVFQPHSIVHDEALAVAAELGLPRWRLNEQALSRGFLADQVESLLGLLAEFGAITAGNEPAVTPLGRGPWNAWTLTRPARSARARRKSRRQ